MSRYPATYLAADVPSDPATAYAAGAKLGRMYGLDWAVNPRHPLTSRAYNFRIFATFPRSRRERAVRAYWLGAARGVRLRRPNSDA